MFAIIGTLVVLGSVLGGFMMGGSSLLMLWHPLEIVVICGAALGAFMISNPLKVIKASFSGALGLVKGARYGRKEYIQLLKLVYDILVMARKDGVLAIERHIEDPSKSDIFKKYPFILADHHMMEFITDCLRLISGGNLDPHELESLLEYELETHHKETAEPSHAVQKVADALPGFGIVAAVLGIVSTMAAIEGASTAEIGHKVGSALVGTFLGVFLAYGIAGPLSVRLKSIVDEEALFYHVIRYILVAHLHGNAAQISVEIGRGSVPSEAQPTFQELEEAINNIPKVE